MEDIVNFLENILRNNNRPWFQEHKKEYQKAQANFNAIAEQIISGVQKFDDNCKGLTLNNMLCTGMYMPDTAMLRTIRDEIMFNGEPLAESIAKAKGFTLDTEHAMKRVPNGYPKDHPQAELFKQRDWLLVQNLDEQRLFDPHLVDWVLSEFEKTKDFCQWLNRTVKAE